VMTMSKFFKSLSVSKIVGMISIHYFQFDPKSYYCLNAEVLLHLQAPMIS